MSAALALLLVLVPPALAHELTPPATRPGWSWEPQVVIGLVVCAALYARGVRTLWRGSGTGHGLARSHVVAFAAGWLALGAALVSPIHGLGQSLFWVHMTQHEVVMLVAAPLLVLGRPLVGFLHGLPLSWRRPAGTLARARAVEWATTPLAAWTIHAVVLWGWHAPVAFQATLRSETVHALQHTSFLVAALLFWWSLVQARAPGAAVASLFTTFVHTSALGALLTFAPYPWYPAYGWSAWRWGLTPLEDQQLGGLVMWVPAGLVYVGAALAILARVLRTSDARLVSAPRLVTVVLLVLWLGGCRGDVDRVAAAMTGGNPARGKSLVSGYGCPTCHTIPGVRGADGLVGPPLGGIASRIYIAGVLPNTPDNMRRWIRHPTTVDALTAMPDMGVGEADARDMTAYLYTLR